MTTASYIFVLVITLISIACFGGSLIYGAIWHRGVWAQPSKTTDDWTQPIPTNK